MKTHSLLLLGLVGGAASLAIAEEAPPAEKKIIYYGWSTRDSAYVSTHWREMEKMPFDGVAINIALDRSRPTTGDGSTGNLLGWQIFGASAFPLEKFREAIRDLQEPTWTRFTDNFLPLAIATRDQDAGLSWFDDRRWATITQNWRVLLTIAREGRARGLLLDPEHYDYECELFNYRHHREQRDNADFARYSAQARARGRQLGEVIREVYPQITIGLLYGYALPTSELRFWESTERGRYALLSPFLDGLLEAAAPEATFVDLWEFGHAYQEGKDFSAARAKIEGHGKPMKVGMSLRIDSPQRGTRWQADDPERNHFSPARFEKALRGAIAASDRYVWIYSEEAPRFFPPGMLPPEYLRAIETARLAAAELSSSRMLSFISMGLAGVAVIGLSIPLHRRRRRARALREAGTTRILFVTGIFPPDHGGPASYVPALATALVRRGHQVEVITLSDRLRGDDSNHPFRVRRIRRRQFWPLRILRTTWAVWRAARRHDLVYVNGLAAEAALGAFLARRPAVHKIVGDYAWERAVSWGWYEGTLDQYQKAPKKFELRVVDAVRTWPLRMARRIIVPSCYLKGIVCGWGLPADKIQVVLNAIAARPAVRPAPVLPFWPGKTLITVCRLVPWKGVQALIRLLPELPATRLVIAGDGHLRESLEAFAQSINVCDRVIFLGEVSPADVRGYLGQSDAFVLNSNYEGLPHVILEAIAAGKPVIATDAGGTGEIIEHRVTGLLVPVGERIALRDAIEELWHDPVLGAQLAEEASARLRRHFDFEAMVTSTEATLLRPLPAPRPRASPAIQPAS